MSSAQVQFRPCRATEDSMVGASAAIPPAKTPFLGIGRSLTCGHTPLILPSAVHVELFGNIRLATSIVEVTKLIDPDMLVEIEAEAIVET